MTTQELYNQVLQWFERNRPIAKPELNYTNPYELLVAVILSAQCTDKRVNMVTPALFQRYPQPKRMADSSPEEIYTYIQSISYPHNKSKHLWGMAKMLVEQFSSQVPAEIEDLMKLPGVGRKTANVIASVIFNQPAMAVDTHVFRVAHRIGLCKNAKTPLAVEKILVKHIPEHQIPMAHHWLILHGRYVCTARKPHCADCGLREICRYKDKNLNTPEDK